MNRREPQCFGDGLHGALGARHVLKETPKGTIVLTAYNVQVPGNSGELPEKAAVFASKAF